MERGAVISVQYEGYLSNGKLFDSTDPKRPPARLILATGPGGVISGMVEGVVGMREGGRRRLEIPWQMGYGVRGNKSVPPRENLTFEVLLVRVH